MAQLVAVTVVLRIHPLDGTQVHTQTRNVINESYDPFYYGTEETCGETAKDWENIITCALRGCREEMGDPNLDPFLVGDQGIIYTTGRLNDEILSFSPYFFVQQLAGPQPWAGPVFVAVVPPEFEPQQDAEGETTAHTWWKPENLLEKLESQPGDFMGFHYPALLKVCKDLIQGKIQI